MDDSPENSLPRIYVPQERESIGDYLQRYSDEELKALIRHPALSLEFGKILSNLSEYTHEQLEQRTDNERLWMEIKKMNNYGRLKQFVQRLRDTREKLIKDLDYYAKYLEKYEMYFSVVRLISSGSDILGSVGGIFMKGSAHSGKLFTTATGMGFAGCLSVVTRTYLITKVCEDLQHQINRDQKLYGRVENWFGQTEKLKEAMLNAFPFETMSDVLEDFSNAVNSEIEESHLLATFMKIVIEKDIKPLRNMDFLKSILYFFSIPGIGNLCKLLKFRLSPVRIEIGKMMLQLTTVPTKHMFFQHIPWLSPSEQTFWSPVVWGRLTFNFLSALHAVGTLKRSEISNLACDMRNLRKSLEDQLEKLVEITNYVELKRSEEDLLKARRKPRY